MNINNDIKRLRLKLTVMNTEGFNQVAFDLVSQILSYDPHYVKLMRDKPELFKTEVDILKRKYIKQLEELIPNEVKQQNLFEK